MIFTYLSALLLLLLLPVIVALHFIRRHRTKLTISSTFLWEEALKSYKRRFFLQTLVRNLPLLLQVAAAVLVILALVEPLIRTNRQGSGDSIILVLDTSASMKTMDGGATRFERTIDEALRYVSEKGQRSRIAVVSGASSPKISGPFTSDTVTLRQYIRDVSATDEPGNMQLVLVTAAGMAPVEGSYRIVLISDGAFDLERPELLRDLPLTYIQVGAEAPNVAITAFHLRPTINRLHDYEMLLKVKNYSQAEYVGDLSVSGESGEILNSPVLLAPYEESTLVFPYDGLLARKISAHISRSNQVKDAFSVDNTAYSVIGGGAETTVHLATAGNFFLEQLLLLHPNISLVISPTSPDPEAYDIAVFDRVNPPLNFAGNAILIGAVDLSSISDFGRVIENPEVTGWVSGHPLIESVDITGFSIFRSLGIAREDPGIESIVHSGDNSLIYTITDADKSVVGISFDISESDLPLRTSFPILIDNILSWLGQDDAVGRQVSTGGTYVIESANRGRIVVTNPDGEITEIPGTDGGSVLTDISRAGFYSVQIGEETHRIAANLLNQDESNISPRFAPWASSTEAAEGGPEMYTPLRRMLLVAALLILLGEWVVWVRRRA